MGRSYDQYCPIACALDAVGERWSLLIVRELIERGPLRYTDLHAGLRGCATNVLAARLRELERREIVHREKLPPPAASTVYALAPEGERLGRVIGELALWGARRMGRPDPAQPQEAGWLPHALRIAFAPFAADLRVAFVVDGEAASLLDGDVVDDVSEDADAVVEGSAGELYDVFVDGDLDAMRITGDTTVVAVLAARLGAPRTTRTRTTSVGD